MVTIGNPEEWDDFEKRHRLFFERYANLHEAQNRAFIRTLSSSCPRDRVIFSLGRIAVDDFQEILVLAGNGYGIGALKVLRGMYERVVTARYLAIAKDSEVENFIDYYWVQQHKRAEEINRTFGKELFIEQGHGKKLNELREQYNSVRQKFLVTQCKKCGTKRPNHSWSKLSLIDMASKVGKRMRTLTYEAYYLPLQHTHGTIDSIHTRFQIREDSVITFKEGPHRTEADDALRLAHHLLLEVLALQEEYFHLDDLKEPLDRSLSNYQEIWLRNDSQPSSEA